MGIGIKQDIVDVSSETDVFNTRRFGHEGKGEVECSGILI